MARNDYVEVYADKSGDFRWRYRDGDNNKIMAESGEGYRAVPDLMHTLGVVTDREPILVESKGSPLAYGIRVVRLPRET